MAKRSTLPLIIMFLVIASLLLSWRGLWIVPGPEGPEATIYGFNPWGTNSPSDVVIVNGVDGPYSVQGDTHNALLSYTNPDDYEVYYNLVNRVVISRSLYAEVRVEPMAGPVEKYNITVVDENGTEKVYWLEAYDFNLEVAVSPRKALTSIDGLYHYAVGPNKYPWDIIIALGSVDWAPEGALEHRAKPIAAYVVSVDSPLPKERQEGDAGSGYCAPPSDDEIRNALRATVYDGSKLDLWSAPYQGRFSDYFENIGQTYEEAINKLPDTAYLIINFPRVSAAYKVNTWTEYTPLPVSKWCVYYVFPVINIKIRVWYLRFAEYQIPEEGLPPDWGTKTPAVGTESGGMADQVWGTIDLFGLKIPIWVLILLGIGVVLLILARGGTKVVVVKGGA